jgi:DNA-binding response OmpR family regulator
MEQKLLIIVVEDDELVSMTLSETLEEAGFMPEQAKTGKEALALLEARHEDIRGIVTDIELGKGANGWDVARRARELIPQVPVVYMSGTHESEWTSHGVPSSTFVGKPFAPMQIVTALSLLLNVSDAS